jgi:hypothetical protein
MDDQINAVILDIRVLTMFLASIGGFDKARHLGDQYIDNKSILRFLRRLERIQSLDWTTVIGFQAILKVAL